MNEEDEHVNEEAVPIEDRDRLSKQIYDAVKAHPEWSQAEALGYAAGIGYAWGIRAATRGPSK